VSEVIAILNDIRPGADFAGARDFFSDGVLDSIDLTTLVAALESRYDVFMDVDEMVTENFCSLAAIQTTLARKGVTVG